MREDLKATYKDKLFIFYKCAAHHLNLLGQDIMNKVNSEMKPVLEIQKSFWNNHQPSGWLPEFETSVKHQLPGGSQIKCLALFLKREFHMRIVNEHEDDIAQIIINIRLYKETKHLHQQLKCISSAFNKLWKEDAKKSDVCEE